MRHQTTTNRNSTASLAGRQGWVKACKWKKGVGISMVQGVMKINCWESSKGRQYHFQLKQLEISRRKWCLNHTLKGRDNLEVPRTICLHSLAIILNQHFLGQVLCQTLKTTVTENRDGLCSELNRKESLNVFEKNSNNKPKIQEESYPAAQAMGRNSSYE